MVTILLINDLMQLDEHSNYSGKRAGTFTAASPFVTVETVWDLVNFRQKLWIDNKLSYAVCVILLEDIAFTPLAQAVDVYFCALGTHGPGYLERRALFAAILGARR